MFGSAKVTVPGPLTVLQVLGEPAPLVGRPSSLTEPVRVAQSRKRYGLIRTSIYLRRLVWKAHDNGEALRRRQADLILHLHGDRISTEPGLPTVSIG